MIGKTQLTATIREVSWRNGGVDRLQSDGLKPYCLFLHPLRLQPHPNATGHKASAGRNNRPGGLRSPLLEPGILHPEDAFRNKQISREITGKLNLIYARDYDFAKDLNIIFRAYRELGRKCK